MKPFEEHMSFCPKCGGGEIKGPRYRAPREVANPWRNAASLQTHDYIPECMEWTCVKCGFDDQTRCKTVGFLKKKVEDQ